MKETVIDDILRSVTAAKEYFSMTFAENWDVDWVMEQFNTVEVILERLKEYD